jgi:hypothetical protein
MSQKRVDQVFGISNEVRPDSYVDRGKLDEELARYLQRPVHIALKGESKCGKSWLRQAQVSDALTVQCRLGKSVEDLYVDALSQLDIRLEVQQARAGALRGTVTAKGTIGAKLLAAVGLEATIEAKSDHSTTSRCAGHDIEDLRFVAELIKASGKRLVIEDFHYMSTVERKKFAFDLKALWEFGLFVVVIGVWSQSNLLLHLNPDLSGRVHEIPIYWTADDLERVLDKGGSSLNLAFSRQFKDTAIHDCFGNVGILQKLIQVTLDELGIEVAPSATVTVDQLDKLEGASMQYAEQLNPLYQQFARRVSSGIRQRADSTGIYAHAMAVILEAPDDELITGVGIDRIFAAAHQREARIQKGNLRAVLEKFEGLQVDEDGRGLVLGYDEASAEISVVDRQLLLYRRYSTVKWPWEQLIAEANSQQSDGDA